MNDPLNQTILTTALKVLSQRVILIVGLLLDFVLFAWAASDSSWERLIGAGGFALLVIIAHWSAGIR